MDDKVTNIRDAKGRFPKGVSGNPHGVSSAHAAIKQMQKENEVLLTSSISAMVPIAARLHKALLKDGKKLTTKEALELIHLTYRYGIGTPRQAEATPKQEAEDFDLGHMSPEMRQRMIDQLQNTAKDATEE